MEEFTRTILLIGDENFQKLTNKTILVCGLGGVGSYAFEALVRMGIKNFIIVDFDIVTLSNINRQLLALHSTVGCKKVDVAKNRALDINKDANIITKDLFIDKDSIDSLFLEKIDYIVDAIDNVTGKILLIEKAKNLNIPIISSMGTGNKLDPTKLKITDLAKTEYCPLAKVMRYELRKRGIKHLDVLASTELPLKKEGKVIASCSFVPSVAGLLIASHIINQFIEKSSN